MEESLMRKISIITIMLLLPFAGNAQEDGKVSLYLSGGYSMPLGSNNVSGDYSGDTIRRPVLPAAEFSKKWKGGMGFGVGIGYSLSSSLSLALEASYNELRLNEDAIREVYGLSADKFVGDSHHRSIAVNGNCRYLFEMPDFFFSPYLLLGVGYTTTSSDEIFVLIGPGNSKYFSFETHGRLNASVGLGLDILSGNSSSVFLEFRATGNYAKHHQAYYFAPIRLGFRGSI
jgi:hypothetical protein